MAIVTYQSAPHLGECLASLARARLAEDRVSLLVVDNASTDDTVALARGGGPRVEIVVNERNLGFGAAANVAIRHAEASGADYLYLLNPDTRVEPDFLEQALAVAAAAPRTGAVQSLLLLAPDGAQIDSAGNSVHFLGFGYCLGHRRPRAAAPATAVEIGFASGAALLLDLGALRDVGPFEESLFLYGEDLDLCWRLRSAGYSILLAPASVVVHDHEFARHRDKMFLLERNRWLVLLRNWSARSLVILAVPLLVSEMALLALAWRYGWLREKLRSFRSIASVATWSGVRAARRRFRGKRRVADRVVARAMTSRMEVDGTESAFLRRFANPAMALAWRLARPLL